MRRLHSEIPISTKIATNFKIRRVGEETSSEQLEKVFSLFFFKIINNHHILWCVWNGFILFYFNGTNLGARGSNL